MQTTRKTGKLFVISASSGAGKTTLINQAIARLAPSTPITRAVTYTTRAPRANEVNGKDYFFISTEEFNKKTKEGFFLETSSYDGHQYGSPQLQSELLQGSSLILITDRAGAKEVRKKIENAVLIWISAPDLKILRERMISRASETHSQIERRLKIAIQEMEEENKQHFFEYHIVNDEFERALEELILVIRDELA